LLINQPKARKIKRKRKKNEKNFLGWIRDPLQQKQLVSATRACTSSIFMVDTPGHFRWSSWWFWGCIVIGFLGGITNTKKKTRKLLFLSGPLPVHVEFLSLCVCVCTTHTDKKQQECYTYTQTNDERLEERGELYHKSEPQSAGTRA
jgi:hypothetical protein